jgi:hypothetical protein
MVATSSRNELPVIQEILRSPTFLELLGLTSTPTESETISSKAHAATAANPTCSSVGDPDSPSEQHDTPNQGNKHTAAAASLAKQAVKTRKTVAVEAEQDIPVGAVVLLPIDKVDQSKVCPKRICVVVECVRNKYWLAYRTGVLDTCLAWQDFKNDPDKTPVLYDFEEALKNWKYYRVTSIQTGIAANSMGGG